MNLQAPFPRLGHWTPRQLRVPGFVLTAGRHSAGSVLPRHSHEDPTICYVLSGGFLEASGGAEAECAADTLKLMPAGEPHSNRFGGAETCGLRIDVDRSRFADLPVIYRALDERRLVFGGPGGRIARRLAGELAAADPAGPVAVEGLVLELVAELARAPLAGPAIQSPGWLLAAEELVRSRYVQPPSVAEIARTVGVHPATLARAYRRRFGCSIGERVRALRVEHAARRLLETTEPLSTIAVGTGFYDQSHFTNAFRRQLGVTPAAYRSGRR
jgi:AraC family transcriptional regulator